MVERIYTINMRTLIKKNARWERSKRSIAIIKKFLKRHMKAEGIKLDKSITEEIWKRGSQRPPGKIRIKVTETEEGEKDEKRKVVKASLLGVVQEETKETKKEEKKTETPKVEESPKEKKK
jgi:large subunit ribosomal protein L31e